MKCDRSTRLRVHVFIPSWFFIRFEWTSWEYFPWIATNGSSTDRCGRAEWSECIGVHISRCTSLWPTNSSAEGVEIGSFSHLSQFCGFSLYGWASAIETPSLCKICCYFVLVWWLFMSIKWYIFTYTIVYSILSSFFVTTLWPANFLRFWLFKMPTTDFLWMLHVNGINWAD